MGAVLSATGIHQPSEWIRSRFRAAVQPILCAARLKKLGSGNNLLRRTESNGSVSSMSRVGSNESLASLGGQSMLSVADSVDVSLLDVDEQEARRQRKEQQKEEKLAAKRRLKRSRLEEGKWITPILRAVDPQLLDNRPGAVNALTPKGAAAVVLCSTLGFHVLRLILRDSLLDAVVMRSRSQRVLMKRSLIELYLLSTIHSLTCATFSLRKVLGGRWDSSHGAEAILCFSLGYTSYTLLALRKHLFSDPLFAASLMTHLVKLVSCLRSRGVNWIVPLLMSGEVPTVFLNLLRLMAEFGFGPRHVVWRAVLGLFTTSFAAIKGVAIPAALIQLVVRRAKEHPELHQPNFLLVKISEIFNQLVNYTWLGFAARHWAPIQSQSTALAVQAPAGQVVEALPSLLDLTSSLGETMQAMRTAFNPISLLAFIGIQSAYVIAPVALPLTVYALAKKPKLRLPAGIGLSSLLALGLWPIKTDTPCPPNISQDIFRDYIAHFIQNYLSYSSVWEEELQKDRRYMMGIFPHGVLPYGMVCLQGELLQKGVSPNTVAASVIMKIPILRQFARLGGVVPAASRSTLRALQWPHPNNVTMIVPGGIAEIFLNRQDVEQVYAKGRKGFIRLALIAGADVVPVYALGHTSLFSTADRSSALGSFLMKISRQLKISLPLSYGRWGMPLIPESKPVCVLVGRPIRVEEAIPEPTAEQIDVVHGQFLAELRRIFDKHKHRVPSYANKRLYFEDEEVPDAPGDVVKRDVLFPSSLPRLPSRSRL